MIRKPKNKPKGLSENTEFGAHLCLDAEADVRSIEHLLFETSPLPMAVMTGSNHILRYVNSAFCRLACKPADQLTGKSFAEVAPWEGCLALLNRGYRTGEVAIQTEPDRAEGQSHRLSYTMWPVYAAQHQRMGVIMQVTETTQFHQRAKAINEQLLLSGVHQHELIETAERLNAELQIEIAGREKMERALVQSEKLAVTASFASIMAHEINNPLEAMTNLVYLLGPLQISTEARAYVSKIEEQLLGLRRIAAHALRFHRDGNKPAEFKLDAVLHEVSDFYRPQAERQGIVVSQRFNSDGTVLGFRSEIVQVVTNLLLNAFDATPPRGQVVIHLYPAPRWLCDVHASSGFCLSIADSGNGITPENSPRIYQPFFTTKGERGAGLGLWVSAGIVNRIGGSIRVRSTCRPGRSGTCFSLFLPARQNHLHIT